MAGFEFEGYFKEHPTKYENFLKFLTRILEPRSLVLSKLNLQELETLRQKLSTTFEITLPLHRSHAEQEALVGGLPMLREQLLALPQGTAWTVKGDALRALKEVCLSDQKLTKLWLKLQPENNINIMTSTYSASRALFLRPSLGLPPFSLTNLLRLEISFCDMSRSLGDHLSMSFLKGQSAEAERRVFLYPEMPNLRILIFEMLARIHDTVLAMCIFSRTSDTLRKLILKVHTMDPDVLTVLRGFVLNSSTQEQESSLKHFLPDCSDTQINALIENMRRFCTENNRPLLDLRFKLTEPVTPPGTPVKEITDAILTNLARFPLETLRFSIGYNFDGSVPPPSSELVKKVTCLGIDAVLRVDTITGLAFVDSDAQLWEIRYLDPRVYPAMPLPQSWANIGAAFVKHNVVGVPEGAAVGDKEVGVEDVEAVAVGESDSTIQGAVEQWRHRDDGILSALGDVKTLRTFHSMLQCATGEGFEGFFNAGCYRLTSLAINCFSAEITLRDIESLLGFLGELNFFHLTYNKDPSLTDALVQKIACSCSKLQVLAIIYADGCKNAEPLTDDSLTSLANKCEDLIEFTFSGNQKWSTPFIHHDNMTLTAKYKQLTVSIPRKYEN